MLVFLAESDQNLRLGLQMLLHQEAGIHVVGMAIQADGLVVQVEASRADLLILDWQLPGANILELLDELGGLPAPPKVIILSINSDLEADAMAAGVDAFVSKGEPPDQLLEAVHALKEVSKEIELGETTEEKS
jgi:DNA-binding NarL/FixJ family response regulator